jgi:hypothetical protein
MGFEFFKKKSVKEAGIAVGAVAALGGAVELGHAVDEMAHAHDHAPAVSTMPAEHVNPTEGMTSSDMPHAIEVPAHEGQTISLGESKSVTIETPQR